MEPITTSISDASSRASVPTPSVAREHVVRTPGTCGGKPRIAGSRIRVQDVVIWHERGGQSAGEIVFDYPQLTLADVHAALACYHDHREEVDAEILAERHRYEQMKATQPSPLREKIERRKADAPDDPLPSR